MKPTDDSRLINRPITNKLIQDLFSYLSTSNLLVLAATTFKPLLAEAWLLIISCFLSPTVQGKLFRQPHCQIPRSTSGYLIQSNSLFDQAFLSTSDHPQGSIGNLEGLLDHLASFGPSRSAALHKASWILHYTSLFLSYEAEGPRLYSFIRRHHYFVAIEGWS